VRAGRAAATTGGGVAPFYRGEGAGRWPVKERSWLPMMGFQCGRYGVEEKG
jgi:hypothetical protein